jgi:hypothetical protein
MPEQKSFEELKKEADELGVKYAGNISYEVLSARIADYKKDNQVSTDSNEGKKEEGTVYSKNLKGAVNPSISARRKAEKLIRCIISCKNPNKKEYQGEIISVGNAKIGFIKKYVLFNEPYHIPDIIFNALKKKEYQRVYTKKVDGKEVIKTHMAKEYDIEILPPLTDKELKDLAQRQLAKNTIND